MQFRIILNKKTYKIMFNNLKIKLLIEEKQLIKKNIRIQDIANGIGMSKGSLENYRDGVSKPTVEMLEKIANYFEVDMNCFFDTMSSEKITVVKTPSEEYGQKNPWQLLFEKQEEITELKCEIQRLKNANALGNGANAG